MSKNSVFVKTLFLIFFMVSIAWNYKAFGKIKIGSKSFTESIIMAEMLAQVIEDLSDEKVERVFNLGGTQVAFEALKNKSIDVYPEYTGTIYAMLLKLKKRPASNSAYEMEKQIKFLMQQKYSIQISAKIGFNNTYALAVNRDDVRFKNISSISDLGLLNFQFQFGSTYEFMEREDGYTPMAKVYKLKIPQKKIKVMNAGLIYKSLSNRTLDVGVVYLTDGRIKAHDLKVLKDDFAFFPPYDALFMSKNNSVILNEAINKLVGQVNVEEISQLNYLVDTKKQNLNNVVSEFLIKKKLIAHKKLKVSNGSNHSNFLNFIIGKKKYLYKILIEHLALSFWATFLGVLFSIPIGIAMTRFIYLEKFIFPVVSTIQTVPSLALLGFMIPFVGIGFTPALIALTLYSLLPLVQSTFTGIKGVDPLFIEASKGMGLTNFQILTKVEIPLAMPYILAGIRTATVIIIGTATLSALIGAGGLGDPIFRGVATVNNNLILLGAIPSALLAILVDKGIAFTQRFLISKGIQNTSL